MELHQRIEKLFAHLGIERAHVMGGGFVADLVALARNHSGLFASLGLICPMALSRTADNEFAMPYLVVTGDQGRTAETAKTSIVKGQHVAFEDYDPMLWSDVTEERRTSVIEAVEPFLAGQAPLAMSSGADESGVVAEIPYRVIGEGPPLALFPLGLSSAQWDPVIDHLADSYRVVLISGVHVEPTSNLEERAVNPGHRAIVGSLLDHLDLQPGQKVLEVGCGSGAIARWIAERLGGPGLIAADVNKFLLNEARMIAADAGIADDIQFKEGDAHSLPFPDGHFDRSSTLTMLEEVDADAALAELVRVTKPGGKIGVMTRCIDIPPLLNLDLPDDLIAKATKALPAGGRAPSGCADSSLYGRMARAGITELRCLPQYNTLAHKRGMTIEGLRGALDPDERVVIDKAIDEAGEAFFIGMPFLVAVGTRP